jgi:hypothetical protein
MVSIPSCMFVKYFVVRIHIIKYFDCYKFLKIHYL